MTEIEKGKKMMTLNEGRILQSENDITTQSIAREGYKIRRGVVGRGK